MTLPYCPLQAHRDPHPRARHTLTPAHTHTHTHKRLCAPPPVPHGQPLCPHNLASIRHSPLPHLTPTASGPAGSAPTHPPYPTGSTRSLAAPAPPVPQNHCHTAPPHTHGHSHGRCNSPPHTRRVGGKGTHTINALPSHTIARFSRSPCSSGSTSSTLFAISLNRADGNSMRTRLRAARARPLTHCRAAPPAPTHALAVAGLLTALTPAPRVSSSLASLEEGEGEGGEEGGRLRLIAGGTTGGEAQSLSPPARARECGRRPRPPPQACR